MKEWLKRTSSQRANSAENLVVYKVVEEAERSRLTSFMFHAIKPKPFPAGKEDRIRKEWLKRTSSRFWRGPMAQRFWVCTDKTLGRWRPKAAEETEKSRRGGKRKKGAGHKPSRVRRLSAGIGECVT